jgi:vang-like
MDVESVRSGRSMRSDHSHSHSVTGPSSRRVHRSRSGGGSRERSRHHRGGEGGSEVDTDREDRSSVSRHYHRRLVSKDVAVDMRGSDRLEVQIIPQDDDNWGETGTAVSGISGDTGFTGFTAMEDLVRLNSKNKDLDQAIGVGCARYAGTIFSVLLGSVAFFSPIVMVILPKTIGLKTDWQLEECGVKCEGLFIGFAVKLLILLLGSWALFVRRRNATMARINMFRAIVLFLVFIITFAFWLFYGVRIYTTQESSYYDIVLFASSFVDGLLFIHYLAVILLEIRHMQAGFVVKIVRSPDGESRSYSIGLMSVQDSAVWCLAKYYRDFSAYNPFLENLPRRPQKLTGFKVYDVDGVSAQAPVTGSRTIIAAAARNRDLGHNDRFYEEQEYERRVSKRRARLYVAAEEAFSHIKRLQEQQKG